MQKHSLDDLTFAFLFHLGHIPLPSCKRLPLSIPKKRALIEPLSKAITPIDEPLPPPPTDPTPLPHIPAATYQGPSLPTCSINKLKGNLAFLKELIPKEKLFMLPPCDLKAHKAMGKQIFECAPAMALLVEDHKLSDPLLCRFEEAIAFKLLAYGMSALIPLSLFQEAHFSKGRSIFFIQKEHLSLFKGAIACDDLLYNWHEKPLFIIPSEDLYHIEGVKEQFWQRIYLFFDKER